VPFLRQRGFAVLRYDKRGVGASTGTYRGVSAVNSETQIAELAGDMAAAVELLAARSDVDSTRLGLMGGSQAGWVMVAAAQRSSRVGFAIAITGSVMPVGVNIQYEDLRDLPLDDAYARFDPSSGVPGFDPAPALQSLSVPTLWLLGGQDRLVPTRECLKVLERLRAAGARTESIVYEGAGHSLVGVDFWPDVDAFLRRNRLH